MGDQAEKGNGSELAPRGAGVSISGGTIGSMKVSRVNVPSGSVALLIKDASVGTLEADQLVVQDSPEQLWASLAAELEMHHAKLGSEISAQIQELREAAVGKPDNGRAKALLRWAQGIAQKVASLEAVRLIEALFKAYGL